MIIGIAGKMKSGKNLIASWLSSLLDYPIFSFANALKGLNLPLDALLSFFPQVSQQARKNLQNLGVKARDQINTDIWIRLLDLFAEYYNTEDYIISDVRFENEVNFIKQKNGVVIYLIRDQAEISEHISEKLNPDLCDLVVDVSNLTEGKKKILLFLSKFVDIKPAATRVYLGGNIWGFESYLEFYEQKRVKLQNKGFYVVNDYNNLSSLKDNSAIVTNDIYLIKHAHAGIWYLRYPSLGSAIEIISANLTGKQVVVVCENSNLLTHPWLNVFAKVLNNENQAIDYLKYIFETPNARGTDETN